jgi:hypothetical protein
MVKKQLLKNYCLSLNAQKIQLTLGILGLSDGRTKNGPQSIQISKAGF